MKFDAVILAGGKSSRMGVDKAWLRIDGTPLLARQIRLAREAGASEVIISGRADTVYSAVNCRVVHDRLNEAGPLGGIESAFAVMTSSMALVLAVDMPKMQARLLSQFASRCDDGNGVIPLVNGRVEPLAAFYPKVAAGLIAKLFAATRETESGKRTSHANARSPSMVAFAEQCVERGWAQFIELSETDAICFENWNSPEKVK